MCLKTELSFDAWVGARHVRRLWGAELGATLAWPRHMVSHPKGSHISGFRALVSMREATTDTGAGSLNFAWGAGNLRFSITSKSSEVSCSRGDLGGSSAHYAVSGRDAPHCQMF